MSRVKLTTDIPGMRSKELRAREAPLLAPGTQWVWNLAGLAMERGQGATLTDVDGNTFIDLFAGIGVCSIGHGHPRLASALAEQAAKVSVGSFTTPVRTRLLEQIAALTPAPLKRVSLYSGGAEAVESALRLARAHTGKYRGAELLGRLPWEDGWGAESDGQRLQARPRPDAAGHLQRPLPGLLSLPLRHHVWTAAA